MMSDAGKKPPYFKQSYWRLLPNVDRAFVRSSEQFGGTVDFGYAVSDRYRVLRQSQKGKRVLFARPFHIFRAYVDSLSKKTPRLAAFNSKLRFGYIRSNIPNAFCWRDADLTYLGVTSGLVHFIFGFVSHLLSFREFLTVQIDGAREEEAGKIAGIANGIDFNAILDWKHGGDFLKIKYRQPRSTSRSLMALNIAHLATTFVFLHELGHAYYRHNEFIGRYRGKGLVHEMYNSHDDDKLSYLSQRFELIADAFAIDASLYSRLGAYDSGLEDASDYMQWSLGVDLILWIFSQRKNIEQRGGSHPHPQVRLFVKALHLDRSNYGIPGRDVDYMTIGQAPISHLCNSISAALFEFWKTNMLPGWNTSFFDPDLMEKNSAIFENLQRGRDSIWNEYESWVDLSLVEEAIGRRDYVR